MRNVVRATRMAAMTVKEKARIFIFALRLELIEYRRWIKKRKPVEPNFLLNLRRLSSNRPAKLHKVHDSRTS